MQSFSFADLYLLLESPAKIQNDGSDVDAARALSKDEESLINSKDDGE